MPDDNVKEEAEDVTQTIDEGQESALAGMDEEQLKAVNNRVAKLVAEDPQINMACAVLVNSRRLYAMARLALNRDMAKLGYKWEDGSEELILLSMGEMAAAKFQREEVLPLVREHIPLFVETEIAMYAEPTEEAPEIADDTEATPIKPEDAEFVPDESE